jgi:hypothetical protein
LVVFDLSGLPFFFSGCLPRARQPAAERGDYVRAAHRAAQTEQHDFAAPAGGLERS